MLGSSSRTGSGLCSGQLQFHLLQVVVVDVHPQKCGRNPDLKSAALRDHMGEQRVGRDERNAQEEISAALIELTAQSVAGYIELKEQMAGQQRHIFTCPTFHALTMCLQESGLFFRPSVN